MHNIHYAIFNHLNKFKVSLLHEKISEISKNKYFVGCYAQLLKHMIYAVMNVRVETSMYIQMLILVRAAFFLEAIQTIQIHHKKTNKHSKTGILMKLTQIWLKIAYGLGTNLKKRSLGHNPFLLEKYRKSMEALAAIPFFYGECVNFKNLQ